jgi:hypothetical protein
MVLGLLVYTILPNFVVTVGGGVAILSQKLSFKT